MPGKKCVVEWFGVSYLGICRLEKMEAENRIKEEIREEIESKRHTRKNNVVQSTYNRLMN